MYYFFSIQRPVKIVPVKNLKWNSKKKATPSTEYQNKDKSIPELDVQKPSREPLDQEIKKKKLKAIDTLKPVVAIP